MNTIAQNLQPYAAVVSAVISVAALVFLVRILTLLRGAYAEQVAAVREQKGVSDSMLEQARDELARTEKWHQRDLELQAKLTEIVHKEISFQQLAEGGEVQLGTQLKADVKDILKQMKSLRRQLPEPEEQRYDDQVLLDMAKGSAAADDWLGATRYYEHYLKRNSEDWEAHFLQAVAYANSRRGDDGNLKALRALSLAITYMPTHLDRNMRARVIAYRGSDLKRLGRTEEAESDLQLARKMATARYEVEDIAYNLACVYAMTNRREEMLRELQGLVADPEWREELRTKREYFRNYWRDPEFRKLIGLGGHA